MNRWRYDLARLGSVLVLCSWLGSLSAAVEEWQLVLEGVVPESPLQVHARGGQPEQRFFPLQLSLVREDGEWRPLLTAHGYWLSIDDHEGLLRPREGEGQGLQVAIALNRGAERVAWYGRKWSGKPGVADFDLAFDQPLTSARSGQVVGRYAGTFCGLERSGQIRIQRVFDITPPDGFVAPVGDEHPRLLFRVSQIPELRQRMQHPIGEKLLNRVRALLSPQVRLGAQTDILGYGLLRHLEGDLPDEKVERIMTGISFHADRMLGGDAYGETTARGFIALAYDLWYDRLPPFLKDKLAINMMGLTEIPGWGAVEPMHNPIHASKPSAMGLAALLLAENGIGDVLQDPKPGPILHDIAPPEDFAGADGAPQLTGDGLTLLDWWLLGPMPAEPAFAWPDDWQAPMLGQAALNAVWRSLPASANKQSAFTGNDTVLSLPVQPGQQILAYAELHIDEPQVLRVALNNADAVLWVAGHPCREKDLLALEAGRYPVLLCQTPTVGRSTMASPKLRPDDPAWRHFTNEANRYAALRAEIKQTATEFWAERGVDTPRGRRALLLRERLLRRWIAFFLGEHGANAQAHMTSTPDARAAYNMRAYIMPFVNAYQRCTGVDLDPDDRLSWQVVQTMLADGQHHDIPAEMVLSLAPDHLRPLLVQEVLRQQTLVSVAPEFASSQWYGAEARARNPAYLQRDQLSRNRDVERTGLGDDRHEDFIVDGPIDFGAGPVMIPTDNPGMFRYEEVKMVGLIMAFCDFPLHGPKRSLAESDLPLALVDRQKGIYALHNGRDPAKRIRTVVSANHQTPGYTARPDMQIQRHMATSAPLSGNIVIKSAKTHWLWQSEKNDGDLGFDHNDHYIGIGRRTANVVQHPFVNGVLSGRTDYLRVFDDGSAQITINLDDAYLGNGAPRLYHDPVEYDRQQLTGYNHQVNRHWAVDLGLRGQRAVAVDYSTESGAEAVWVVVDEHVYHHPDAAVAKRHQPTPSWACWQAIVRGAVEIDGQRAVVSRSGEDRRLIIDVVHPPQAVITAGSLPLRRKSNTRIQVRGASGDFLIVMRLQAGAAEPLPTSTDLRSPVQIGAIVGRYDGTRVHLDSLPEERGTVVVPLLRGAHD